MHTQLCEMCLEVKPSNVSIAVVKKWRAEFGKRTAIERSVNTLCADADWGLIENNVCFSCTCEKYTNGEGIEVSE